MNFDWEYISNGMPRITLSRNGISINKATLLLLGKPQKILIGFDSEKLAIGIKTYNGEEHVKPYNIGGRLRSGWVRCGCKDFICVLSKRIGIDFKHARSYIAKVSLDGIVYITLAEGRKGK